MSYPNLTIGIKRSWFDCMPDSYETYCKCGGSQIGRYVLQVVSPGQSVKYVAADHFGGPKHFNGSLVDDSTLIGKLSVGMLDLVLHFVILTQTRAKYIDYGFQTYEDSVCIFFSRKLLTSAHQNYSSYFIKVLDKQIKLLFIIILWLYIIVKLILRATFKCRESFPWFRKASFGFASVCFALLYNNDLKADMLPKKNWQLPFRTLSELVHLIKSDNYKLVIDSLDDYRMEMINNSRITSVRRLSSALTNDKIRLINYPDIEWYSLQHPGTFTINNWNNYLEQDQNKVKDIVGVCPSELPKLTGAYGFSKKSKLTDIFNQRAQFVYAIGQRELASLQSWHHQMYHGIQTANGYNRLHFRNTDMLFNIYLSVLLSSLLICCGELAQFKLLKPW